MTLQLFWPIKKIDSDQRLVYGYASTEATDSQGEIVTREALEAALPGYMRFANIREMHQPSAVGVAREAAVDEKGLYLKAEIVDDDAWRKVREGVYRGFSIGGAVTQRASDNPKKITGVDVMEISLVDRPANPEAVFSLWKSAGAATFAPADTPTSGVTGYDLEGAAAAGEGDYADPGYQSDGQKRYPLDSAERIRAAWGYIHHKANQKPYTAEQVDRIKARIVAAWKAKIDRDGPPAAANPVPARVGKGLATAARLALVVDELRGLLDEAAAGGYADGLAKLMRGEGDADDSVQAIHDHAVTLGAHCAAEGSAKVAGMAMAKLIARNEALEDRLGAALPLLGEVRDLVAKIAAQPAVQPPARLVAIDKGADVARELERIAEQPPAMTALELIKRAVREPLPFGARLER